MSPVESLPTAVGSGKCAYLGCRGIVGNITRHDLAAIGCLFEPYRLQGSDAMLWPVMPQQLWLNNAGANTPLLNILWYRTKPGLNIC